MKIKSYLILFALVWGSLSSQISTYSPYSRYGIGEINNGTFAHNQGMAGACLALKPDSTMPIFINPGNPASYALIRLTTLEVGGLYNYSQITGKSGSIKKWNTNFAYASLGFPVRSRGGACIGIMPFSNVGYEMQTQTDIGNIGTVTNRFNGSGGLNKAYVGYGVMPFNQKLIRFRKKNLYVADSNKRYTGASYRIRESTAKLISDLSIGFNVNFIFGSLHQVSRVIYPNSLLYNNTYRERATHIGDFTGNFGLQTAITKDSIGSRGHRRAMKEKVKFTFGFFAGLNNALKANYTVACFNYILNGFGDEVFKDTVLYKGNVNGTVKLPLELGIGVGFKKGEKLQLAADAALTQWSQFRFMDYNDKYYDSYRFAIGMNYVPEKYAAGSGAFWKKLNYRVGANHQTGFLQMSNGEMVSCSVIAAGIGIPVGIGRLSSMVNISGQYGMTGTLSGFGVKENFWKISFGFNFSDRWFMKFRYD